MISDETARRMSVKFLRENGQKGIANKLEKGGWFRGDLYCLEHVFMAVVRKSGKKGFKNLLLRMPQQLRNYVYWECLGSSVKLVKLDKALDDLFYGRPETDSDLLRPERLKDFAPWMAKVEKTIMAYLDGNKLPVY